MLHLRKSKEVRTVNELEYCLNSGNIEHFKQRIDEILFAAEADNIKITISEWRDKGTDPQRRAWWVIMGQVAKWMDSNGIQESVYITVNGKPQKITDKPPSKDFAHELTMYKLFPVEKNGRRKSLVKVMKDKYLMCETLDRVFAYYAERGCHLTLTTDDPFGHQDYQQEQNR